MPTSAATALSQLQAKRRAVPAASSPAPARSSLVWFVPGGSISQFPHPAGGKTLAHIALDIAGVRAGAPVYEPVGGIVTSVQRLNVKPSFGLNVRVLTPAGIEEVFAHLSESDVKPGDRVSVGQFLGRVGNSGTQDVHLHYETRKPGSDYFNKQWTTTSAVDPIAFLKGNSSPAATSPAPASSSPTQALSRLLAMRSSTAPSSGVTVSAPATSPASDTLGVAGAGALNAPGGQLTGPTFPAPAVSQAKAPKETTLLKTPAGNVTIPAIHWWNVFGFALGAVLIVVALAQFAKGGAEAVERGTQRATSGVARVAKTQAQLAKLAAMLA